MEDFVVLVDKADNEIGTAEKLDAHKKGLLHRAFSIFVFNSKGELLLQKRAKTKYHCGGLWTNTCCSHPRPGEDIKEAVHRRLMEEMGFDCKLEEAFVYCYSVLFDNGLSENEIDHAFVGRFDSAPVPNPEEADSWKWVGMDELKQDIKGNPDNYTYWFKVSMEKLPNYIKT